MNVQSSRPHLLLLGVLMAAVAAWLVFTGVRYALAPARAPETLTIADASQPVFALIYVAEAKGYLHTEGLQVSYDKFLLGRDALAHVIDGKADLATAYNTPVVTRIYEGNDICIVSTLHSSVRSHVIVARRDRGIVSAADLAGKKVGVTSGTTTAFFLSVFLATEGIPPSDVATVPVEPGGYERALTEGTVDALVAYNPYSISLPKVLGPEQAVLFSSDVWTETSMLAGRCENLARKREAVVRFLRALVRAQEFVERYPADSIEIVARRLSDRYAEADIRAGWGAFKPQAQLDNVLQTLLTQEAQWLRDTGKFDSKVPDFTRRIAAEYLRGVTPGAVTLLAPPESSR